MEMKVGKHIQSSYSKYKNNADTITANAASAKAKSTNSSKKTDTFSLSTSSYAAAQRTNADTFTKSPPDPMEVWRQTAAMRQGNLMILEPLNLNLATDDFAGRAKFNFDIISYSEKKTNEAISQRLEEAGVPKDVTFEFDYNYDSGTFEITEISDETYRESVEKVLDSCKSFKTISCASRVMNGYKSSILYPWVSAALESSFGQDINDLYIDENGNLGGVNKNLQAAINAENRSKETGEYIYVDFYWENIEELLKRLVSDENITPNISHMGYDGECIYTNDGEFKFGKDFDPNLFNEEKYIMRGTSAFIMSVLNTNLWLKHYDKFY